MGTYTIVAGKVGSGALSLGDLLASSLLYLHSRILSHCLDGSLIQGPRLGPVGNVSVSLVPRSVGTGRCLVEDVGRKSKPNRTSQGSASEMGRMARGQGTQGISNVGTDNASWGASCFGSQDGEKVRHREKASGPGAWQRLPPSWHSAFCELGSWACGAVLVGQDPQVKVGPRWGVLMAAPSPQPDVHQGEAGAGAERPRGSPRDLQTNAAAVADPVQLLPAGVSGHRYLLGCQRVVDRASIHIWVTTMPAKMGRRGRLLNESMELLAHGAFHIRSPI